MRTSARARALALTATGGLLLAAAAGCAGSTGSKASASGGGDSSKAQVLYAGSLVNLMEKHIGPGFTSATGHDYQGIGEGSVQLANEIKGKVRRGDVFISANPDVNSQLEGPANGKWVSWYAAFASAPLLLAYNPQSKFAAELKSGKPWYDVVSQPGFHLGQTDPKLDPKGKLSAKAEKQAEQVSHESGLAAKIEKNSTVFPEETLVGRLESGQLDAGFFYANEATEQKLPTVDLGPVKLAATYTVTVLNQAPDQSAAESFVSYLLGADGTAALKADGLTVLPKPKLSGDASTVPASLRKVLSSG